MDDVVKEFSDRWGILSKEVSDINKRIGLISKYNADSEINDLIKIRKKLNNEYISMQGRLDRIRARLKSNRDTAFNKINGKINSFKKSNIKFDEVLFEYIEDVFKSIDILLEEHYTLTILTPEISKDFSDKIKNIKNKVANKQIHLTHDKNNITLLIGCWEIMYSDGFIQWELNGERFTYKNIESQAVFNLYSYRLSFTKHKRVRMIIDLRKNTILFIENIDELFHCLRTIGKM